MNRPKEAEDDWRKAVELLTRLKDEQPAVPIYRQELARGLNELGIFLASGDRGAEAEKAWGQVLDLQGQLIADFPGNPVYREEMAKYHGNVGILYAQGNRLVQAEKSYRQAIALLEELEKANPDVVVYAKDLIEPYANLIALRTAVGGGADEVEKDWRRLAALKGRLADAYPKAADLQSDLGATLGELAGLPRAGGKAKAREYLEEAVRRQRIAVELSPQEAGYRRRLCGHSLALAQTLLELNHPAEAAGALADLVQSAPAGWTDYHLAAACLGRCAGLAEKDETLPAAKREELARAYGDRAVELLRQGIAQGYKDGDYLKTAVEFQPLRSRDDFKKLVAELEKKRNSP
jgi:tetratricopeptide (TPR) repeat protein